MVKYLKNDNLGTYNLFIGKEYNFKSSLPYEYRLKQLNDVLKITSVNINDSNYKFNKAVFTIQQHTNIVKKVVVDNIDDEFTDTDGLITNLKNVALCTNVADCQAILLYDPKNRVIGNIHSGWKGTLKKIIVNAINIMINDYNCNPENIKAYICPSILKCCFEVDREVVDMFNNNFNDIKDFITYDKNTKKYFIDLIEINKKEMLKLGLKNNNIFTSSECTKCSSNNYHSYRKDKENSGRNLAIIWMK